MNKLNNVNYNINFYLKNLRLGNKIIYFTCLLFCMMVFLVVFVTNSNPTIIRTQAQNIPCQLTLNQFEICYVEYVAPPVSSTAFSTPAPVKLAQSPIGADDFITSTPAQSQPKPVDPTPTPTPTPDPKPVETSKPVETPKPSPTPTSTPSQPTTNTNLPANPVSQSSQPSPSSASSTPSSASNESSTPKSQSSTSSVPEFGLGQTGTVASISTSKSAQATKDNTSNWTNLLLQNWIYIVAGILGLLFLILIFSIIRGSKKPAKQATKPAPTNHQASDLDNLTYRLDNMPPEIDVNQLSDFDNPFEISNTGNVSTANIPTFDSDNLNFNTNYSTQDNTPNHPFEPINPIHLQESPSIPQASVNQIPVSSGYSSLIQERLSQIKPAPRPLNPYKQAQDNLFWVEYNQAISGKKSKPFPLTIKDRIFFAYSLAYITVKVYVVDWDLWGE